MARKQSDDQSQPPPTIDLPEPHPGQIKAFQALTQYSALCCGRRFGKTKFGIALGAGEAIVGHNVGWFTPAYKYQVESYNDFRNVLDPVVVSSSKTDGVIKIVGGGGIDFWSLENENAGRGREYDIVVIDETSLAKPAMKDIWRLSIKPTLLVRRGRAIAMGTPLGVNEENFFYRICHDQELGFSVYHATAYDNPFVPRDELEKYKKSENPLVFEQEYMAKFVDWSGISFFSSDKLLVDGAPVPYPAICDYVLATIDTAGKINRHNDGTAVSYWARSSRVGHPLVLLDWDVFQITGDLLEVWLPTVFDTLERLARECRARLGSGGAHIEDAATGTVLIQKAARMRWPVHAIESSITMAGKDARAISASGAVHRGEVKISAPAYNKLATYKGATKNHWLSQVCGYKVGVDNIDDDLLDTMTTGVAVTLGNSLGLAA